MLSISHGATGAFIAVKVGNPFIAVPLILLSHYIEDKVHHWDVGTGMSKGAKSPRSAFLHELIDLSLTVIIISLMFPFINSKLEIINYAPIWGAFFGLLPDFLEAPRNFFKWEPAWLKPINKFHGYFHNSIPNVVAGLAPQILLLIILFLLR